MPKGGVENLKLAAEEFLKCRREGIKASLHDIAKKIPSETLIAFL
jgi:hypothetical protein